jgi:ABC-type amino acid transport substrate-binding protein
VGYDTVREYSLRSPNLSSIDKKRGGYVRGTLGAQKALDDTADTVILLGSAQSSNLMLLSNRIDAFVGLEIEMALGLKKYDGDADIVSRKLGEVSFYSYLTDFFTDQQKAEFNSYLGEHIAAQGGPLSIADVFPAEFIERLRQERE